MKSVLLKHSTNSLKILPKLHVGPLHPNGHKAVVVVEIEVVVIVVFVVVVKVVFVVVVVVAVVVILGADVVWIHSDMVDRLQESPVQPSKQRQRSG